MLAGVHSKRAGHKGEDRSQRKQTVNRKGQGHWLGLRRPTAVFRSACWVLALCSKPHNSQNTGIIFIPQMRETEPKEIKKSA